MKQVTAVAIIPSLELDDGASINESELLKAMANNVSTLYVLTLVALQKYPFRMIQQKKLSKEYGATIITIPNITPFLNSILSPINIFFYFFNSLILFFTTLIITFKKRVNFVYVRDPRIAIAFAQFKGVFPVLAIKYPGFYVQELKGQSKFTLLAFEKMNYRCITRANPLIVHSPLYEPLIKSYYNIRELKTKVVTPGINYDAVMHECHRISRCHLVPLSNSFRVGFIGSSVWWNGIDILIEAMGILAKNNYFPDLYIAGLSEKNMLDSMKKRCSELNIKAYFFGLLPRCEALKLLSEMDVLVCPRRKTLSTETTIPIKVIESFAVGTPVIITKHRIFQKNYVDTEDLIFCDPDPESVANKINYLMNNPSIKGKISKKGILIAQEFDYKKLSLDLVNDLLRLYEKNYH